jgi:predicted transcriptional regulator
MPTTRYSDIQERALALQLWREGRSQTEIAFALGRQQPWVSRILAAAKRLGEILPRRRGRRPNAHKGLHFFTASQVGHSGADLDNV